MSIRKAFPSDLDIVKEISEATISEIYPKYYPKGAVDFFLAHHNQNNILNDIKNGCVYLFFDKSGVAVATVTVKSNEICRLFVLPGHQSSGLGTKMLDFAEKLIAAHYSKIRLDASLPAKQIYLKRGYKDVEFNTIQTENNDFLCYDVMEKQL